MLNRKEVESQTNQLGSLKVLIQTYEEIAALHMRKIRSTVLTSRSFIDELELIYQQLQSSYKEQITSLLSKKKQTTKALSEKNGKSVTVFLSANTRLYGDIVQQTFQSFSKYIKEHPSDIFVVGKLGQSLMNETLSNVPYIYKDLPDTDIQPETLVDLLTELLNYEKIYIFYGRFQTIASQKPFMLDVYGQGEQIVQEKVEQVHYLFEPSLEKILQFFEEQIFATIIEQSFRESELAKYAARMVALDSATENINLQMRKVDLQKRIVLHHILNQKQQQSLVSSSMWRTY